MEHLIDASETLAKKILEKHLQHMCENICNIQINTIITYV
jgi:hypothetical protein